MLPDLLVASSRWSELQVVSSDLRSWGSPVLMPEPMDALWLSADEVLVAGKDTDGRSAVTRVTVSDRQPTVAGSASVGMLPCALVAIGNVVFTACYSGGRIDVLEISAESADPFVRRVIDVEGEFPAGPRDATSRQEASHPHDVVPLDDGRRALICDLGADRLYIIDSERLRVVETVVLPKGSGPRKALVGPDGSLVVVCELDSTIRCFALSAGVYVQTDWSPTTSRARELNYAGDVVEPKPGMYVVANRGNGTLAAFRVERGRLQRMFEQDCGGAWPASLDARSGRVVVANEHSNSVALFDVSAMGLALVADTTSRAPSVVRFAP